MSTDRRSHPTIRPHALVLGVFVRPGGPERLSFLGASTAVDLSAAMLLDTLGALSTFPVRHRLVFAAEGDPTLAATRLPATWKRPSAPLAPGRPLERQAMEHVFSLGGEASLLVVADAPIMPLGELFDGLLALAQPTPDGSSGTPAPGPRAALVGRTDEDGVFALGLTKDEPELADAIPWGRTGDDAKLRAAAAAANIEIRTSARGYVVDDVATLKRLKADVEGGAFAPNCRKLMERSDVTRAVAGT
jgi:glycosyltransferase A (GT-A) superfamily protein (DUF2064 family)